MGFRCAGGRRARGVDFITDEVYRRSFVVIGERVNPTGKPKLAALREGNYEVLDMALEQKDNGAHIPT